MKFKITLSRKIIFSEGLLGNICLPGMLDFQYSDINIKQILGHHDLNYFDSWAWTGWQFVNWRTWPWCWNTWLIESASTSITSITKNLKTQKIQTAILQKAQGWFLLGKKSTPALQPDDPDHPDLKVLTWRPMSSNEKPGHRDPGRVEKVGEWGRYIAIRRQQEREDQWVDGRESRWTPLLPWIRKSKRGYRIKDWSLILYRCSMEVGRKKQRFYLRSHSERILFSIQSLGEIYNTVDIPEIPH